MLLHSVDRRVTGRPCVRRDDATLARGGHRPVIRGCTATHLSKPPRDARNLQPGTSVPIRCADASDHRPRQVRDVPPIAAGGPWRLRFMCAVTRHTGGTRGVDHGPSSGRRCCEGLQRRSRPGVTSRATMSDRPRAWDASGGTHRSIIADVPIASRSPSGRRSRFPERKSAAGLLVRPQTRRRAPAEGPVQWRFAGWQWEPSLIVRGGQ